MSEKWNKHKSKIPTFIILILSCVIIYQSDFYEVTKKENEICVKHTFDFSE